MTIDLKDLKAKAEAATPGPWIESFDQDGKHTLEPNTGEWFVSTVETLNDPHWICAAEYNSENDVANFRFIAAANPEVVLKLIARIEKLERESRSAYSRGVSDGREGTYGHDGEDYVELRDAKDEAES